MIFGVHSSACCSLCLCLRFVVSARAIHAVSGHTASRQYSNNLKTKTSIIASSPQRAMGAWEKAHAALTREGTSTDFWDGIEHLVALEVRDVDRFRQYSKRVSLRGRSLPHNCCAVQLLQQLEVEVDPCCLVVPYAGGRGWFCFTRWCTTYLSGVYTAPHSAAWSQPGGEEYLTVLLASVFLSHCRAVQAAPVESRSSGRGCHAY